MVLAVPLSTGAATYSLFKFIAVPPAGTSSGDFRLPQSLCRWCRAVQVLHIFAFVGSLVVTDMSPVPKKQEVLRL